MFEHGQMVRVIDPDCDRFNEVGEVAFCEFSYVYVSFDDAMFNTREYRSEQLVIHTPSIKSASGAKPWSK